MSCSTLAAGAFVSCKSQQIAQLMGSFLTAWRPRHVLQVGAKRMAAQATTPQQQQPQKKAKAAADTPGSPGGCPNSQSLSCSWCSSTMDPGVVRSGQRHAAVCFSWLLCWSATVMCLATSCCERVHASIIDVPKGIVCAPQALQQSTRQTWCSTSNPMAPQSSRYWARR